MTTHDDPKRPPWAAVTAILEQSTDDPHETLRQLAQEFPAASPAYIREILRERMTVQSALLEETVRERRASAAVVKYLHATGHDCLVEASVELGLPPMKLWAQIMDEAGLPGQEMPEAIQVT
jgi:DNA-binding transcriptional regulator YbjK